VAYITAITTIVSATNAIVSAPTRMQNKGKVFLVTNVLSPLISYLISIPLLIYGYYVIALPIAMLFSSLSSELIFLILNRSWFKFNKIEWKYLKQLLAIGIPLLPTFLIYWVFNSTDRIMITNILGIKETGIYSVGAKLGHVSQLIYTAFAGGWQFFAFSIMKENNQVETNSKIFEYLGIISYSCAIFMFVLAEPIYRLLFTGEFSQGYIVSPYLFLSPLLLMLFQVAGNQFLVIKKTWPIFVVLSGGAIVNIYLNFLLIPIIGIEGASIATLLGYSVSVLIVAIVLHRMKLLNVNFRFIFATLLITGFIILWRLFFRQYIFRSSFSALCVVIIYLLLYKRDLKEFYNILINRNNHK
jgi:O-antigen/teichoic acid export membrane protein